MLSEYLAPGALIVCNIAYNIVINVLWTCKEQGSDYCQPVSDGIQAIIAILTLILLTRNIELSYKCTKRDTQETKRNILKELTAIDRENNEDQQHTMTQLNNDKIALEQYEQHAKKNKSILQYMLFFLFFVTAVDISIASIDKIKNNSTVIFLRIWLIPFCWLLELYNLYAIKIIEDWNYKVNDINCRFFPSPTEPTTVIEKWRHLAERSNNEETLPLIASKTS